MADDRADSRHGPSSTRTRRRRRFAVRALRARTGRVVGLGVRLCEMCGRWGSRRVVEAEETAVV